MPLPNKDSSFNLNELKNFTGIDSEYQPPEAPEIHLFTTTSDAESCCTLIHQQLGR